MISELLQGAVLGCGALLFLRLLGEFSTVPGRTIVVVVNLLVFFDMFDVLIRLRARVTAQGAAGLGPNPSPSVPLSTAGPSRFQKRLRLHPYAVIASVHDAETEIHTFVEAMEPYRHALWLIDDASTDRTRDVLAALGCRYVAGGVNRRKPGAIRELLRHLPPEIETVVVFDPDSSVIGSSGGSADALEDVIADFQRSGMAAACPRLSIRPDGPVVSFQEIEYAIGLGLGRKSLADCSVNSGISIYKRSALEEVLEKHTLSVYAEDLENSLRLLGAGERIYYDDRLVVETEGKRTARALFSQRVGWAYGHLRVYTTCLADLRKIARRGPMAAYQFVFYLGVVSLLLQPVRALFVTLMALGLLNGVDALLGMRLIPDATVLEPSIFVSAYTQYLLLMGLAFATSVPRASRVRLLPYLPLYFFYAMWLVIPTTVGFANRLSVRVRGERVFNDHYQDAGSLREDENALAAA